MAKPKAVHAAARLLVAEALAERLDGGRLDLYTRNGTLLATLHVADVLLSDDAVIALSFDVGSAVGKGAAATAILRDAGGDQLIELSVGTGAESAVTLGSVDIVPGVGVVLDRLTININ